MQILTYSRLKRLDENGFTVRKFGKHHALVRKWSTTSSFFKARFSIYILVKVIDKEKADEET